LAAVLGKPAAFNFEYVAICFYYTTSYINN
jgi:hypothetical protein